MTAKAMRELADALDNAAAAHQRQASGLRKEADRVEAEEQERKQAPTWLAAVVAGASLRGKRRAKA